MNGHFNLGDLDARVYFFGTACLLGLLFAFISADSENLGFGASLLIWQAQTVLPIGLVTLSHVLLGRSTKISRLNGWVQLILSGCIGATLFSPLALGLDLLLIDEKPPESLLLEFLDEWSAILPPVTIAWVAINAPWMLGYKFTQVTDDQHSQQNTVESPPVTSPLVTDGEGGDPGCRQGTAVDGGFMQLLPSTLGVDIVYMEAELHYLKVVTVQGRALILYSLKDAVTELPEDLGMVCHRSFWLSKNHIEAFRQNGRQGILVLSNGFEVPVSRRKLAEVRAQLDLWVAN